MKVLATRKDESLFQGLSRTEEISPGNFGFYATWIALAVILSVFVISAPSFSYFSILSIPAFSARTCSCSASTFSSSPQR